MGRKRRTRRNLLEQLEQVDQQEQQQKKKTQDSKGQYFTASRKAQSNRQSKTKRNSNDDNCGGGEEDKSNGGEVREDHDNNSESDSSEGATELELGPPPKKRLKQESSAGTSDDDKPPPIFIAIHLGAGEHSIKRKDAYKALCKKACDQAKLILLRGGSASDAVVAATVILEDSGIVNAGSGSSLTLDKKVECDAAFMNGDGYFGGVGAVPGIRNPILVAKKMADMHEQNPVLSCGRVPPTLLTGTGARDWAVANGISKSENSDLISKTASKLYDKYMKILVMNSTTLPQEVCDTVGAIAIDKKGNVACTVSSGGNWLKQSGRIGLVPLFGCGIWASKTVVDDNPRTVAISCSGAGEMLSKVQLPQKVGSYVAHKSYLGLAAAMSSAIEKDFIDSKLLNVHREVRNVGLIGLVWDGARLEVAWGHSSQNFVIAFNGSGVKNTQMSFSSFTEKDKVGKSAKVTAIIV